MTYEDKMMSILASGDVQKAHHLIQWHLMQAGRGWLIPCVALEPF